MNSTPAILMTTPGRPVLAQRGRGAHVLERCVANGAEGGEVRVMNAPARIELGHAGDQRAVRIGRRPDDELHRHAGGAARVKAIARTTMGLRLTLLHDVRTRLLQGGERSIEVLLRCDARETVALTP